MVTLIVLDDLGMLLPSKNWMIQKGLSFYTQHLQRIVKQLLDQNHDQIVIAGPREVLKDANLPNAKLIYYDQLIDQIDWLKAGNIASLLADKWNSSEWLRRNCPYLFDFISVPKVAYVRLAHLFSYDPAAHYLLINHLLNQLVPDKVILLDIQSEIEKITFVVTRNKKISTKICASEDPLIQLKHAFIHFLYERDRRLHAKKILLQNLTETKSWKTNRHEFKKNIFLIPAHSLHFKTLIPLAKKINVAREFSAVVLLTETLSGFQSDLEKEEIQFFFIEAFKNHSDFKKFWSNHKKLTTSFRSTPHLNDFKKEFESHGIDWYDILKSKIYQFVRWTFSEIFLLSDLFRRIFAELKPNAVFVFSDARFPETVSSTVAKALRIPVFFYSPNPMMSLDEINRYNTGDYLLVGGSRMKKIISDRKWMKPENIFEVGDIRFDDLAEWKSEERKKTLKAKYGYQENDKVFLLISWYTNLKFTMDEKRFFFEIVRDAFKKNPHLKLIIKAHPNENEEMLQKFVQDLGFDVPVVKNVALYELLAISSGVILTASMTSLEAMMFDVPVLSVDLPARDYDYYIPLKREGGAIPFKNSDELSVILNRLVSDSTFGEEQRRKGRAFVSQYIHYPQDSKDKAGEKILKIINDVLAKTRKEKTVAIIQARMSSARLPKKTLLKIGNLTALEHVVKRAQKARLVDQVIVATSDQKEDNPIERECARLGIPCFRGSLQNVLARYCLAARSHQADIVVRITADSIFLEPEWIDKGILEIKNQKMDYVGVKLAEEFPTGMGNEVITLEALEKSLQKASTEEDFEHVTWYCLSHRDQFKISFLENPDKWHSKELRLALDERADYQMIQLIWSKLKGEGFIDYETLGRLYRREPFIFEMNKNIQENPNLYVKTLQ